MGSLGDFHPAPAGLRQAAAEASEWLKARGENLASLALRYAISQHIHASPRPTGACTIFGGGSIWEIDENLATVKTILESSDEEPSGSRHGDLRDLKVLRESKRESDEELVLGVRKIFGPWIDFGFTSPDKGWDVVTKSIVKESAAEP